MAAAKEWIEMCEQSGREALDLDEEWIETTRKAADIGRESLAWLLSLPPRAEDSAADLSRITLLRQGILVGPWRKR